MTSDNKKAKIKILKGGPYIVSGGVPLLKQIIDTDEEGYSYKWLVGREFPKKETYSLCRCGQSKNKPYCDGNHSKVGFEGTETASKDYYMDESVETEGPELILTDVWSLCDHSRFCQRAGGIRDLISKSDNPLARKMAIDQGQHCPSGRLIVWDKKTGKALEPEFEQSIVMIYDPKKNCEGPIWVRGGIPIESSDGNTYEVRNRVTLCQCGKSENKPFCDGNHWLPKDKKEEWRAKWDIKED